MIYGPMVMGDTASFQGVFQILNVLRQIEEWGHETYWPWLRDTILMPLKETTTEAHEAPGGSSEMGVHGTSGFL